MKLSWLALILFFATVPNVLAQPVLPQAGTRLELDPSEPPAALLGTSQWVLAPSLSVSQGFSDNPEHEPNGSSADTFTLLAPSITARRKTPALQVAADYSLLISQYLENRDQSEVQQHLQGLADWQVNRNLTVSGRAIITQVTDEPGLQTTAPNAEESSSVYSYELGPTWRYGDPSRVSGSLSYLFGNVFTNGNSPDAVRHQVLSLTTLSPFENARFDVTGSASYLDRLSESDDGSGASVSTLMENRITRIAFLRTELGYDYFDDSTLPSGISSPIAVLGMRLGLSSRTSMLLAGGYRYSDPYWIAKGQYELGRTWHLDFEHSETIETAQGFFLTSAASLSLLPSGSFEQPFSWTNLGLTTDSFRRERTELSIVRTGVRSTSSVGIYHENRDIYEDDEQQKAIGFSADLNYAFSPRIQLLALGQFQHTSIENDVDHRNDNEFRTAFTARRKITPIFTAFASLIYSIRESTDADREFDETVMLLGARADF